MKILHTSDWHLGQKFISREREDEHAMALNWLSELIFTEKVDLLIVAGDIFDIGNPPSTSRALYYNFLKKLWGSGCRHVVITGGNHDSPQMLDAPKEILKILNVHIVGRASTDPADDVILLKDPSGKPEAIIAAVPFLRDQDLRRVYVNETGADRIEGIRQGILAHYRQIAESAQALQSAEVPTIATGHLCVTGSTSSDKQNNIYLGSLENIEAAQFPELFDYVALGHIHRAQAIDGKEHIRYSGSLIPLSFSETKDLKSVTIVQFSKSKIESIRQVEVPMFRRLKTIEGSYEYVQSRLEQLNRDYADTLPAWVEVLVESDRLIPNLNGLIQDYVREMNLEVLKTRMKKSHYSLDQQIVGEELDDLEPIEVFRRKCESAGREPDDIEVLLETFRELETWMNERAEGS